MKCYLQRGMSERVSVLTLSRTTISAKKFISVLKDEPTDMLSCNDK